MIYNVVEAILTDFMKSSTMPFVQEEITERIHRTEEREIGNGVNHETLILAS